MSLKKPVLKRPDKKSDPEIDRRFGATNNVHKPPRGNSSQLNVRFPDEKLRDVKICSATRGITMSQLVELAWDEWRARNSSKS